MNIAFVGCGYVADYYAATLSNHPQLVLTGVYDQNLERGCRFQQNWKVARVYESLEGLVGDAGVDLVINLTNPASHFAVSRACLLAGKHVYSEKPLAMSLEDAEDLVRLAEDRKLYLGGAPCNVLGEAAQTVWKALRDGLPGRVRLVYAELETGLFRARNYETWRSPTGLPWPHVDEFEIGLALEHAGCYVSWLVTFFGPARRVTAFASCQDPEKDSELPRERMGPDFTVSCIEFDSGVVARVTCGWVAPHNHGIKIFGDAGTLSAKDAWDYATAVHFDPAGSRPPFPLPRSYFLNQVWTRIARRLRPVRTANFRCAPSGWLNMDFCRGIAEMADAIREQRPCRISARFALHVNEIVLAMQPKPGPGAVRELQSTFEPMRPMDWA